ncbi:MAG: hypothetical protein DLM54_10250 [Acidimicrobiales bacterium]|nr:MAG: hypothetical protein DLM54_10250 [Acidimicrobiales bacterium]
MSVFVAETALRKLAAQHAADERIGPVETLVSAHCCTLGIAWPHSKLTVKHSEGSERLPGICGAATGWSSARKTARPSTRFTAWFEQKGQARQLAYLVFDSTTSATLIPAPPWSAGIPAKVVSQRLGHANVAITLDT